MNSQAEESEQPIAGPSRRLLDRSRTQLGIVFGLLLVVAAGFALLVAIPALRRGTAAPTAAVSGTPGPPSDVLDNVRSVSPDVVEVSQETVADEQGRVTLRLRFDAPVERWTGIVRTGLVVTGSEGSVVTEFGNEGWSPHDRPARSPYSGGPWEQMRQVNLDVVRHHQKVLRRNEGDLKAGRIPPDMRGVIRAEIARTRAEIRRRQAMFEADGVCVRREGSHIATKMMTAVEERVFLVCKFRPGERVRADYALAFTGERIPGGGRDPSQMSEAERRAQIEDLRRRNGLRDDSPEWHEDVRAWLRRAVLGEGQ